MKTQAIRTWFAQAQEHIEKLRLRASQKALLQQRLVANGFPATEMNAFRNALAAAEEELHELQRAVYSGLDIQPIEY